MTPESGELIEQRAYRKLTWHLLPFLFTCYVFAYLDRVNVGFAKLQMLDDLGFSETMYGLGAGIFFVGYFLFGVPSNLLMCRLGARLWIGALMVTWGCMAVATMFVQTAVQFYVLRFLLGAAEAGFIPGVLLYLTCWYPSERRGRISALFLMGIPFSGVIGGPLSGLIMGVFSGQLGLEGWRWLFFLQGLPSVLLGIMSFYYLPDSISTAKWLSQTEKDLLHSRINDEVCGKHHHALSHAFAEPRVWLLALIYAFYLLGLYAVSFWLPSLIKASGVNSPLHTGLLSAIPYIAGTIGMGLTSRHSDLQRERRWHLAIPGMLGALGLILSTLAADSPALAIAALTLGAAGVCTTVSQFWSIPSAFLGGLAAAAGIAFINSVGNISGFVAPYLVGWIKDTTGKTDVALWIIAGAMIIASSLIFIVPARLVNK